MDFPTLKARVESLLELAGKAAERQQGNQLLQGTLTVFSAVYGPESHQVKILLEGTKSMNDPRSGHMVVQENIWSIHGSLQNLKAELDAGFTGSLQKRIAGDVLTNFIQLARVVLDDTGEKAKNVAAVLAAAAYEDTIRRMGATFAGVIGRDDLPDVIEALKHKGVLKPPQLGIALGYLNFRNRALHANWDQIDRASVSSALGFVEELLLKHFQ